MPKVYVEGHERMYVQMYVNNGWTIANHYDEADLIQFTGGEDVTPSLYGEGKHPSTYNSVLRDTACEKIAQWAMLNDTPMAGICRGSQFLCVMGGGSLWQDVDGHATGVMHDIIDLNDDSIVSVSSTHHQQHRPADSAEILAVASPRLCTYKDTGDKHRELEGLEILGIPHLYEDVEAFYYPHIKALGFQPHPEFFGVHHPCQVYYFKLIEQYLNLRGES